ncbi:MAG: calcium-binding EGF-like domain-containing protein [Spirochaetaceae bacterium]|nr:calcium-binding EGF-like domain-containing protein [Spirochaetaceae bacterium]
MRVPVTGLAWMMLVSTLLTVSPAEAACPPDDSCSGNGICVVNACVCDAGFTGTNCEIDVDECAPAPCQNGGACFDLVNGYTCSCPPGFTGLNCETVVSAVPSMSWRAFFLLVGLLLAVGLPGLRRHLRRAP